MGKYLIKTRQHTNLSGTEPFVGCKTCKLMLTTYVAFEKLNNCLVTYHQPDSGIAGRRVSVEAELKRNEKKG